MSKKSTRKPRLEKPRFDFPLFPHATNRWAKKIRGKLHYFGKVWPDDPKGEQALQRWLDQKDELLAGRIPRAKRDLLTTDDVVNLWLAAKKKQIATGELSQRCWEDYKTLGRIMLDCWDRTRAAADLGPDDFGKLREAMGRRWGPTRLANSIQRVRCMFNWLRDEGLLPLPTFGAGFKRPPAKLVRAAKNARGPRMMTPEEIHRLLKAADPIDRAAILLAANGGIGPSDLARLPITALDLDNGWISYPRHKTEVPRRIPLWPETVAAIRAVFVTRPVPAPGHEEYLFLRPRGAWFVRGRGTELLSLRFSGLAKAVGLPGKGLYDLRRGFQTVGERSNDPTAVSAIMGHAPKSGDMAATYRQRLEENRLRTVVDVVHDWLFGPATAASAGDGQEANAADPLGQAIAAARAGIAAATGPTRRTLESVWLPEIQDALEHPRGSAADRLLEVWYQRPDDPVAAATTPGERPQLRLVGA